MKKIMFNDRLGLTDAVLEGRKSVTRRIANESNDLSIINGKPTYLCKQQYQVGEVIAIAQKYKDIIDTLKEPCMTDAKCWMPNSAGWNNKMFVKAEFMPHQIEILDVRVERLQDITDEDCIKEGISSYDTSGKNYIETVYGVDMINKFIELGRTPREAFASLIDKVSGKSTWESNPYVFRYEFKLK